MKTHTLLSAACGVALLLGFSTSARAEGDDGDLLKKAEVLLKQAWNPGGDAPSNDQRTDLLNQAIKLAQAEPDRRLAMQRVSAIRDMKAALEEIKLGDPDHKVDSEMQDADRSLRAAIEIAESH